MKQLNNSMFAMAFVALSFIQLNGQSRIGIFDNSIDIGNCKVKGHSFFNEADQTYIIGGAGYNIWHDRDEFQYLWTTLQGDFILRAEIQFKGKGVVAHRKAGWIIRNSLDDNTEHISASVHGDGLTSLQTRQAVGGETIQFISPDSFPDVVQLERTGNRYVMSTAKFGEELTRVEFETDAMDEHIYAGLFVCSHDEDLLETAIFRNVRIVRPVDPDYQPYRDYIGSRLEVMDVNTGHRKVLYESRFSIQAPNWTSDGKYLLYNSEGRLYRYELNTGEITPFNTGFAVDNNNDHVLSFDGTMLGISHHNADDNRHSTIYILPSTGDSTPIQVSKKGAGHCYLHCWSVDRSSVLFTGNRGGQYDIFSLDLATEVETPLTNKATVDDGPEYSPDGKYIYFNSARTGTMQLWRMDPDGGNKTQLTSDSYNDWFPHISPDGKTIVFISFPSDIDPNSHPFYKECMLRIMPAEGGTPKVIGYLYGGQGTINVPSWSPDSRFIAFVTNSKI